MFKKTYGIIETLSPLHVGATAGEESGNLNLIFRDQFTNTGIIPGSSIRGRLRSEMYNDQGKIEADKWYGNEGETGKANSTTESIVKIEYASIVWIPVFCPGQPIVWVSCPRLLKRYQRIVGHFNPQLQKANPQTLLYKSSSVKSLKPLSIDGQNKLFFNFGFLKIQSQVDLSMWFPSGEELPAVVVSDDEIGMIHDMALYRQSRVALEKEEKKAKDKAFFNTEALPEGTILFFPIAIREDKENQKGSENKKPEKWQPFTNTYTNEIYLGGLESIGFGHCTLTIKEV
jgi:CRISPR-associated protein Cmr4